LLRAFGARNDTLLLALLALPSCGSTDPTDPFPGVTVTTNKASYTTAEPVVVTLTNTTSSAVYYFACPERWDHNTEAGYVRVEELEACPAVITSLDAGQSKDITYTFPDNQPAGIWRIPIPITSPDGKKPGEARSGDFRETD
jgi:hypothetical protein